MKKTRIKRGKDDYLVFAKFCIDNSKLKPAEFIKKANGVDLLRNRFSNSVLYNYFLYSKKFFNDGYVCKGMPEKFKHALSSVLKGEQKQESVPVLVKRKRSYEDIIALFEKEEEELVNKYNKIREENSKKIVMLNRMNSDALECFNRKMIEIKEKRDKQIIEYFERV